MWQKVEVNDKIIVCTSEDEYPEYQEMNGAIGTVRRVHACAIVFVEFDNQKFRDQTFDPNEYRVLTPIERYVSNMAAIE